VAQNFPQAYLIRNQKNIGFTRANNQGIYASSGRYVLLLNSDTVVTPDVLTRLIQFMENHPDAGAIGPRLSRPSGEPQAFAFGCDPTLSYLFRRGLSHLLLRHPLHDWNTTQIQTVDWVSGACVLVRREAIDRVGLLDENIFMYFEDNDWCLRIRQAGWKVYYNPQVTITHLGGQSLKQNPAAWSAYYHSLDYFYAKHYGSLARWALRVSLLPYRLLVRN
jgi:GT2 family glycosyltransferase